MKSLRLFGSDPAAFEDDFWEFTQGSDAIMLYDPVFGRFPREYLVFALRTPVFWMAMCLYMTMVDTMERVVRRELGATADFYGALKQANDDRPIHRVGYVADSVLAARSLVSMVANWLVLLSMAVVAPSALVLVGAVATIVPVSSALWRSLENWRLGLRLRVVTGFVGWGVVLGGTVFVSLAVFPVAVAFLVTGYLTPGYIARWIPEKRVQLLAADVASIADERGYETICLCCLPTDLEWLEEATETYHADTMQVTNVYVRWASAPP
ncbi:hypothetical protein ACLI4U_15785 [Natrialbaceae archaeon A-CW2]|uniref:hypothetical protein n=1 Tax=Natronosalvus amylolyticus TaxID=2961994 RepID=UPI0020C9408B|nr:hypothetical protein [Natronosalvus amylolyticus]